MKGRRTGEWKRGCALPPIPYRCLRKAFGGCCHGRTTSGGCQRPLFLATKPRTLGGRPWLCPLTQSLSLLRKASGGCCSGRTPSGCWERPLFPATKRRGLRASAAVMTPTLGGRPLLCPPTQPLSLLAQGFRCGGDWWQSKFAVRERPVCRRWRNRGMGVIVPTPPGPYRCCAGLPAGRLLRFPWPS